MLERSKLSRELVDEAPSEQALLQQVLRTRQVERSDVSKRSKASGKALEITKKIREGRGGRQRAAAPRAAAAFQDAPSLRILVSSSSSSSRVRQKERSKSKGQEVRGKEEGGTREEGLV